MLKIGLISDTHGLLRPQALAALRGSDFIVHAGDIGDASILEQLAAIAPVTAVRGNNDCEAWAGPVPERAELNALGRRILVVHSLQQLGKGFDTSGLSVIVSGHSHRPRQDRRDGVLYVNPGSAGPRRFSLPVSMGELLIDERDAIEVRLIDLDVA
jgi:putative phosphoesterase